MLSLLRIKCASPAVAMVFSRPYLTAIANSSIKSPPIQDKSAPLSNKLQSFFQLCSDIENRQFDYRHAIQFELNVLNPL
jgi:hypothetical protein